MPLTIPHSSSRSRRARAGRLAPLLGALFGLAAPAFGVVLKSDRVEVLVDDTTGALQRITDLRDGTQVAGAAYDAYVLQPTPETKLPASEAEDRVIDRRGDVLVCENPKLPRVTIEKSYAVENGLVTKHVEFKAGGNDLGFLLYNTATNVPKDFFRAGYLNNPSRHVVNTALPYLPVAGIQKEFQVFDINPKADHRLVIYTNPEKKRGLAQYRFKVDGQFSSPLSSYTYEPGLFYSPDGWRMAVAAKWLSQERGDAFSCDVRWHLFDGDHLAFHDAYLNLPEWKATWATDIPAWMQEVKGVITWDYTKSGPQGVTSWDLTQAGPADFPRIKAYADSMADGYLMVLIRGLFHNTRAYLADPIQSAYGDPVSQKQLQEWVSALKALSPRIKVGPITWQWAFGTKDPVFKEHPEWTVHGADGKPAVVVSAWEKESAAAQLLTPEARRFVLEQYAGLMQRHDFDFVYMDTGQGGNTMLDWRSKRSAQDYDWALLYKGIRDIARTHGGGSFLNGVPNLFSLYSDFGYYEGYNPHREHWQARSDRLVLAKVYQRPNEKRTIPLYWKDGDWTTESYPKLCYTLAIKPGGFDFHGEFEPLRWPMIGALLEIEAAELMPTTQWSPCWWREDTDMEVYALRLGQAGLLTAYNRSNSTQKAEVSLDLKPYGFDPSRPIHVWRFDPKTLADLEHENTDRLTEAQVKDLFARTGRAPVRGVTATFVGNVAYPKDGRLAHTLELESSGVAMLMFTQASKLAYAKDDQPTHFLLPASGAAGEQAVAADAPLPEALAKSRQVEASGARTVPRAAAATPTVAGTPFEDGAVILSFSGGAKLAGNAIEIPAGGAIDATGLVVTTLKASRAPNSPQLEIWITYSRATDFSIVHKHVLETVPVGSEAEVHLDLNQFAPKDWTGRVQLETKGEGGTIRIVFNSKFQLF